MIINLTGKIVEDVRKRMVTAETAEESIKIQSKITYDSYKQYETLKVGGDRIIVYSFKRREMTFSKPTHIGFTFYELSKLLMYKT